MEAVCCCYLFVCFSFYQSTACLWCWGLKLDLGASGMKVFVLRHCGISLAYHLEKEGVELGVGLLEVCPAQKQETD